LRQVFGPGRYRVNDYGFKFDIVQTQTTGGTVRQAGWVRVPTGSVGVVTYLANSPAVKKKTGIQQDVLPPGIYPVNPYEQQIDLVPIGFWETSLSAEHVMGPDGKEKLDESGEPEAIAHSGIGFPSSDGYEIQLDFTAIWGVMPKDAPAVVRTFGSVPAAEQKVIIPQSESISRINGSKLGAKDLLVGESRQQFQTDVSEDFQEVLKDKHLSLLYALVRHIYIPKEIRVPLQKGYVADELKLTRDEERTTKTAEGELLEAEKKVLQEAEKVKVETEKLVAEAIAEGQKQVGETEAQTKQQVAAVDKQIAELDAQKIEKLGKAKADADQLMREAESQKFQLAVDAFGNPAAYTRWQFAEGLPMDIQLQLFYAGDGTLWTDLKNLTPTLPVTAPSATPKPAATSRPPAGPASPATSPGNAPRR
jgi:regulator of protease activity HflC (stomatin/prohibitin superfamily)